MKAKSILAVIVCALSVLSAQATGFNCKKVNDLETARECFYHYGLEVMDSYEGPNTLFLVEGNVDFQNFYKGLKYPENMTKIVVKRAQSCDYVGVALVHMDEHEIAYFCVKNGEDQEITQITSENLVDVAYMATEPLNPAYSIPSLWFLGGTEETVVGGYWDLDGDLEFEE